MVRLGDEFFALQHLCPHQMAFLHEGRITVYDEIVCPLHEYRFDLRLGSEGLNRCGDAETFRVIADENGVAIELPD